MMLFQIYAGYGSVFKFYRFQNLPAKNVPFSCERSLKQLLRPCHMMNI